MRLVLWSKFAKGERARAREKEQPEERDGMEARVLALRQRPTRRHRRARMTEAVARAESAAGLHAVRSATGLTPTEWAEAWSEELGVHIDAGMIAAWEDPIGPKPPAHWTLVAYALAGDAALAIISSLLLS